MRQEFYPLLPWKTTSELGKSNGKKEGVKDKALGLDAIHICYQRQTHYQKIKEIRIFKAHQPAET